MPVKSRPGTEKAALVDELARLGGDDYRFWGDGDGTVDSKSQEFKDYSGITVAVLRSRVANFSPQRGDSEEEEQSEREESSEEESDEEFFEPEPAADGDRSPAAAAAVTPAPGCGGIFGGPADITPAKQALASGNLSDDDDLAAAVSAQQSVADSLLLAGLEEGAASEVRLVELAVEDVIKDAQGMEPLRAAALVATMSNEMDRLVDGGHLSQFEGAEERSQAEQDKLVELQKQLDVKWAEIPATESKLTQNRPVVDQSRDERAYQEGRIKQRLQFGQPHVSTAGQPDPVSPTGSAGSPPPESPAVEAAIARFKTEWEQKHAMAAPPARVGSLVAGPPPALDTADNVVSLTKNLQDAPLVADLVRKGLLKTEDVLSEDYVQAMESRLRAQAATKIAEGRDVRYTSARAGFRPPVNVSQTPTPGVYRVKPRRFLRAVAAS